MGVNLLFNPGKVSLAYDRMPLGLSTTDAVVSSGVAAVLSMQVIGQPSLGGDDLIVEWGNTRLEFEFANSPDDSGLQLPVGTSGGPLGAFADSLAEALSENYTLSNEFLVTRSSAGGEYVVITAREDGPSFDITATLITGSNFLLFNNGVGVDEVKHDDHFLFLEIQRETAWGSGVFEKLGELLGEPDANNRAFFDLGPRLRAYMDVDLPPVGGASAFRVESGAMRYRMRYGQRWGRPGEVQRLQLYSSALVALPGGSNWQWRTQNTNLYNRLVLSGGGQFLSHHQFDREVSPTEPVWLHALVPNAQTTTLKLRAQPTYTDGTLGAEVTLSLRAGVSELEIIGFPAHYSLLQPSLSTSLILNHWEVWAADQNDNPLTDRIPFVLDEYAWDEETIIAYQNSFGVVEIFRARGHESESTKASQSEDRRVVPVDATTGFAEYVVQRGESRSSFVVHSGYLNQQALNVVREIQVAQNRWLLKGGEWLPFTWAGSGVTVYDTGKWKAAKMECMVAQTDRGVAGGSASPGGGAGSGVSGGS